jgi:hypothetical protein
VLKLETGTEQPDAMAFYERHGYRRIPNFGHYADSELSVCYERALVTRSHSTGARVTCSKSDTSAPSRVTIRL